VNFVDQWSIIRQWSFWHMTLILISVLDVDTQLCGTHILFMLHQKSVHVIITSAKTCSI
jgi:hypothetical protein